MNPQAKSLQETVNTLVSGVDVDMTGFFKELGMPDLSDEKRKTYENTMKTQIVLEVMTAVDDMLTEADHEAIEAAATDEAMLDVLSAKGIDIITMAQSSGTRLREELLANKAYFEGMFGLKKDA